MSNPRFGRTAGFCSVICVLTVSFCFSQDAPPAVKSNQKAKPRVVRKVTISKETTWATEPVGPQGFVDYRAVLNRHYGRGVTPANNAVVLLYQAFGPAPNHISQPPEFFRLLGVQPPAPDGRYFEEFQEWCKRTGKTLPEGGFRALEHQVELTRLRPWTEQAFPDVAEWLQSLDEPLKRVTEATQRSEYYSPVAFEHENVGLLALQLPAAQASRSVTRALISRAMFSVGSNDEVAAWKDLLTIHRLGRLVGRGPTEIEGLIGSAIEMAAIDAELRVISETHPKAKFVVQYLQQLAHLPPKSPFVDKLDFFVRVLYLDCCQQLLRDHMLLSELTGSDENEWALKIVHRIMIQSVDWDEVLKSGNRWFDRMVKAAGASTYREKMAASNEVEADLLAVHHQAIIQVKGLAILALVEDKDKRNEYASNALIATLRPAFIPYLKVENRSHQRLRNLELALALAAWRDEHQAYPEKLEELAPKYIKAVPNDLFTDQPLHYTRTDDGYRLYSVAENQIDDLGLTYADGIEKDDLTVQMPMPRLPSR
jgi:hypothetical protein